MQLIQAVRRHWPETSPVNKKCAKIGVTLGTSVAIAEALFGHNPESRSFLNTEVFYIGSFFSGIVSSIVFSSPEKNEMAAVLWGASFSANNYFIFWNKQNENYFKNSFYSFPLRLVMTSLIACGGGMNGSTIALCTARFYKRQMQGKIISLVKSPFLAHFTPPEKLAGLLGIATGAIAATSGKVFFSSSSFATAPYSVSAVYIAPLLGKMCAKYSLKYSEKISAAYLGGLVTTFCILQAVNPEFSSYFSVETSLLICAFVVFVGIRGVYLAVQATQPVVEQFPEIDDELH